MIPRMQRQVDERMKHQHTKKCAFTFIYRIYQIWHCQACPHVDIHDRYLVPNKVHRKSHLLCSLTWMKHDGVLSLRNFLTCLHQRKGSRSFSFYVPSTFAVRQSCFFLALCRSQGITLWGTSAIFGCIYRQAV